jgi:hypothetical protein
MDGHHLRIISSPEEARTIQTRAARNARIDKLGVDRSQYRRMPSWERCIEAQAPEKRLSAEKAGVTFDEYLDAWRGICALPKATKYR